MRILRSIVIFSFNIYFKLFLDVEKVGTNDIPKDGAYILCSNHIHWMDPILYVSLAHRMTFEIAKEELFSNKIKAFIMRRLGLIRVDRNAITGNRDSLAEAVDMLNNGDILIIYPEGTRFGLKKGIKPKKGVAMIALQAKVPIIPMAMVGSFKPFTKVRYIIDKPMDISEYYPSEGETPNLRNMVKITNKVMDRIVELRDSINTEVIEKQMNDAEEKKELKKNKKNKIEDGE